MLMALVHGGPDQVPRMERHTFPELYKFGWNRISLLAGPVVMNFTFGGLNGYSAVKSSYKPAVIGLESWV